VIQRRPQCMIESTDRQAEQQQPGGTAAAHVVSGQAFSRATARANGFGTNLGGRTWQRFSPRLGAGWERARYPGLQSQGADARAGKLGFAHCPQDQNALGIPRS